VGALAWLLVPLIVTALAFVIVGARSRPERPIEAERGMEGLDRFREAMARPMPAPSAETVVAPEPFVSPSIEVRPARGKGTAAA